MTIPAVPFPEPGRAYYVRHTAPVWVQVDPDSGKVLHVVVEDEHLSEPTGYVTPDVVAAGNGWTEEDVRPLSAPVLEEVQRIEQSGWPAWDFGW